MNKIDIQRKVTALQSNQDIEPIGVVYLHKSVVARIKDFDASIPVFRHSGLDMSPTIIQGAWIGVDRCHWKLEENELYMFEIENFKHRPVRRLIQIGDGWLLLGVDNPKYLNVVYPMNEVKIFGQVKWILNEDAHFVPTNNNFDSPLQNIPFIE